jgi:ketosteroid isomerase-like protein
MQKIFLALFIIILASVPAGASEKTDVMATVHQFVDGFNKGDTKATAAVCTDQMSIIDEFPPHEWHGAGAMTQWLLDYDADAKKKGISDGNLTLKSPRHIDITGDRAYVVVPANYTFKMAGKLVRESGSMFTLALQKVDGGWRITGWAWSKH